MLVAPSSYRSVVSPLLPHGNISIKWLGEGSPALGASMSHHLLRVSSLSIEAHGALCSHLAGAMLLCVVLVPSG